MITIRQATKADIDAIHALGATVAEFAVSDQTVAFWPKAILARAVESSDVCVGLAEDATRIVGFVIASVQLSLKKATIENMFVIHGARRQGVGRQLVNYILSTVQQRGCEYVATLVPGDASDAARMYTAVGFTRGASFVWFDTAFTSEFKK